ncbi:MAG: transposase [Victivallaceae bacterium]|nr:transposase [Victivallaceae bacterium]
MAGTIRDKMDGIVSFWTFRRISNASMEGFNNKIRWLIRQAYGFRDREYNKIENLPITGDFLREKSV